MDSKVIEWRKFCNNVCDTTYRVRYEQPSGVLREVVGVLKNFNPSSQIVMYVEKVGMYIIPYNKIEWMYPTRHE